MELTKCFICGASVPDTEGVVCEHTYMPQSPGCWKLYTNVLEKEYGEWKYPDIHRLTVDCYAAQHPTKEPNQKSAQSVSVHLLGIYLYLEKKVPSKDITKIIGEVVKKNKGNFKWLKPPTNLGEITISDVTHARSLEEHNEIVKKWADSIWKAWKEYHGDIIQLRS